MFIYCRVTRERTREREKERERERVEEQCALDIWNGIKFSLMAIVES